MVDTIAVANEIRTAADNGGADEGMCYRWYRALTSPRNYAAPKPSEQADPAPSWSVSDDSAIGPFPADPAKLGVKLADPAPSVAEPAEVLADSLERLADGHLANHMGALRVIVAARMLRDHARIVAEKDAKVRAWQDTAEGYLTGLGKACDRAAAAEARADALAVDAARYRWLRGESCPADFGLLAALAGGSFDAAIDALLSEAGK